VGKRQRGRNREEKIEAERHRGKI
jgi:hypothetical protein